MGEVRGAGWETATTPLRRGRRPGGPYPRDRADKRRRWLRTGIDAPCRPPGLGCLSPPHPSRPAAVPPSPKGKAGRFLLPFAIHPALVVVVTGSRAAGVVGPYGDRRCPLPFNRAGRCLLPGCGRFLKRPYGENGTLFRRAGPACPAKAVMTAAAPG